MKAPRYRNPDSELHIKRIDTKPHTAKQTHGFQVHFRRGDTTWTKFFSDSTQGGKEDARSAARKFRDHLEKTIPESKTGDPMWPSAVGYTFRERTNSDGSVTRYISASARDRKRHAMNRQFRVVDDDIDAAIRQALKWRKSVVAQRLKRGR